MPEIKDDIKDIEDIKKLVREFYSRVLKDEVIGPIFLNELNFKWDTHLPVMFDFWESILFHTAKYKGNPILVHIKLNQKTPLTDIHFENWMRLWENTIDSLFKGEVANLAKQKAQLMKSLMQHKINESNNPNFIQ